MSMLDLTCYTLHNMRLGWEISIQGQIKKRSQKHMPSLNCVVDDDDDVVDGDDEANGKYAKSQAAS